MPDLSQLMRDSDVFVLPSVEEGSALVTYEAQACGCVLAVSDATGARCEHRRTGLVHPARDVDALAAHLRELDRDPALLQRLRAATIDRLHDLTWDRSAARAGRRLRRRAGRRARHGGVRRCGRAASPSWRARPAATSICWPSSARSSTRRGSGSRRPGPQADDLERRGERVERLPEYGRSPLKVLPNLARAFRVLRSVRPAVVVASGASLVVPFCVLARLAGARIVFIETTARVGDASLSGRVIGRLASAVLVQWAETAERYRRAVVCRPALWEQIHRGEAAGEGTFVAVGTRREPFDRLLEFVDDAVASGLLPGPVTAQSGHSSYAPRHYDTVAWLTPDQVEAAARGGALRRLPLGLGDHRCRAAQRPPAAGPAPAALQRRARRRPPAPDRAEARGDGARGRARRADRGRRRPRRRRAAARCRPRRRAVGGRCAPRGRRAREDCGMSDTTDLVVVGAGILGLAVARERCCATPTAASASSSARTASARTRPATTRASCTRGSTTRPAR